MKSLLIALLVILAVSGSGFAEEKAFESNIKINIDKSVKEYIDNQMRSKEIFERINVAKINNAGQSINNAMTLQIIAGGLVFVSSLLAVGQLRESKPDFTLSNIVLLTGCGFGIGSIVETYSAGDQLRSLKYTNSKEANILDAYKIFKYNFKLSKSEITRAITLSLKNAGFMIEKSEENMIETGWKSTGYDRIKLKIKIGGDSAISDIELEVINSAKIGDETWVESYLTPEEYINIGNKFIRNARYAIDYPVIKSEEKKNTNIKDMLK